MQPFTKTVEGVELTLRVEAYGSDQQRVLIQFMLDESGYSNAEVLPKSVEVTPEHPVVAKLEAWATTIINDRIATKKRQEEEAAAEAAAKEAEEDNQE